MTSTVFRCIFIALVSYFLGNISPARILGRIYNVDITKEGSGNPGTTNVIRTLGIKAGLLTLVIDALKAFIAVRFGMTFMSGNLIAGATAFVFVILGHCFPVLYHFKGGKGVAAAFGAALSLNWPSALIAFVIAVVLLLITKRMSIGSLSAAVAYPFLVWWFDPGILLLAVFLAIFLILTHIPNIKRLFKGEEQPLNIGDKLK